MRKILGEDLWRTNTTRKEEKRQHLSNNTHRELSQRNEGKGMSQRRAVSKAPDFSQS